MTGFADLVAQAQPALVGGGVTAAATEGRSWAWKFTGVVDTAGTAVDLSSVTVTCTVVASTNGSTLISLTGTGAEDGSFAVSATAANTANLVPGADEVKAKWSCYLTSGSTIVQVWDPQNSDFAIRSS